MSDEVAGGGESPFRYHLELTPAQLKLTHTALRSLLDDFGHEDSDVLRVIREVLDKLPDEHAIRAIRLDEGLERDLATRRDAAAGAEPGERGPGEPPRDGPGPGPEGTPAGDPPDSVA